MGRGRLEVITGPMFAGKTSALLDRVTEDTAVFTPDVDDRYGEGRVATHDGRAVPATVIPADRPAALRETVDAPQLVGIDEANLFGEGVVEAVTALRDRGCEVVVAGLDTDFRGEPFHPVPRLMERADAVRRLTAECGVCGGEATRTQRLIDGEPAPVDGPQVVVGGEERYVPRCTAHHAVRD